MSVATEGLTVRLPVQAESTLPPLLDELPTAFQPLRAQLENWSSEALRRQMYATVDEHILDRYDELLAQNVAGDLSTTEDQELAALRRQNDLLMYQKAYAALLLKWRGERVPTLTELEASA